MFQSVLYRSIKLLLLISAFSSLTGNAYAQARVEAPADTATPTHLALAQQILAELPPDGTSYRHRGYMRLNGEYLSGSHQIHTDCSGLVSGLLDRTHPKTFSTISSKTSWRGNHPQATSFVDAIQQKIGFLPITHMAEVKVGDIVAMRYPPGNQNTGHILLIETPPTEIAARPPIIPETKQWQMQIIDSTSIPHGQGDSRLNPDGSVRTTGMGRGYFRLYSDESGQIIGYAWSLERTAKYYDNTSRPVVVGRVAEESRP